MKFTPKEIELCKKIAELGWGKSIKYGDWYEFKGNIYLITSKLEPEMHDIAIPLWRIHDCLEWLRKKSVYVRSLTESEATIDKHTWYLEAIKHSTKDNLSDFRMYQTKGKTTLEVLLSVILAILEEK